MNSERNFREQACPICGKNFIPATYHSWKVKKQNGQWVYACSYTCMRKWEKTRLNPKDEKKQKSVVKYRSCKECPKYQECAKGSDLRRKRRRCGYALQPWEVKKEKGNKQK